MTLDGKSTLAICNPNDFTVYARILNPIDSSRFRLASN